MQKLKNEKDLSKISGGVDTCDKAEWERHKGASVDKYKLIVGKKYVIREYVGGVRGAKCGDLFYIATCIKTWEKPAEYGSTIRTHIFRLESGEEKEVYGSTATVWEYIA